MQIDAYQWLPLHVAAARWGYTTEGLRRRLRQLRILGYVKDIGRVPHDYTQHFLQTERPVVLLWINATTALIHQDAPTDYLIPKRGKRVPLTSTI